jgi:long-subunit acyl-CoA synthetase (AMP-forming)
MILMVSRKQFYIRQIIVIGDNMMRLVGIIFCNFVPQ